MTGPVRHCCSRCLSTHLRIRRRQRTALRQFLLVPRLASLSNSGRSARPASLTSKPVSPVVRERSCLPEHGLDRGAGRARRSPAPAPRPPRRPCARRRPARPSRSARWTKSRSGRERSSRSRALGPPAPAPVRASSMFKMAYDRLFRITRRHVERLPGLRPQRLDRVHRRPVGLEAEHRAVRAGDGGAGGQRQALADRPAGQLQPVVRRAAGGRRRHPEPAGGALVGDDGARRACTAATAAARVGPVSSPVGRAGRAARPP